jgi:hypothetical protein
MLILTEESFRQGTIRYQGASRLASCGIKKKWGEEKNK